MRVLAIDGGLEKIGVAVFTIDRSSQIKLTHSDLFLTKRTESIQIRLSKIQRYFRVLIKSYKPSIIVLEKIFTSVNLKTATHVHWAMGAILAEVGLYNIPIKLYSPTEIKMGITGYGRSDKKSVQKIIELELGKKVKISSDDEADAIATGYFFCLNNRINKVI